MVLPPARSNQMHFAFLKAALASLMASLPLFGLVLFFELTRAPSEVSMPPWSQRVARLLDENQAPLLRTAALEPKNAPVRHFPGISARLNEQTEACLQLPPVTSNEAGKFFSELAEAPLAVGLQREYLASNGRKVFLKIVRQEAISDEAIPDSDHAFSIAPTSSGNLVRFVWGAWRYSVEIIEFQHEPPIAVQKSL
jgi:hypothetical protein